MSICSDNLARSSDFLHYPDGFEISKKFLPKKRQSLLARDSLYRLSNSTEIDEVWRERFYRRSENMSRCGSWLRFASPMVSSGEVLDERHFHDGKFCHDRLCIMCQFFKSRRMISDFYKVLEIIGYDNFSWTMDTFTFPNLTALELDVGLRSLSKAWNNFTRTKRFKSVYLGGFRKVECTINNNRFSKSYGTYNVHVHTLDAKPQDYFTNQRLYISQSELSYMWTSACSPFPVLHADRNLIVDTRKVYSKNGSMSGIPEVFKYETKPTDIIVPNNSDLTDTRVFTFSTSFYHFRNCAYFGILKDAYKLVRSGDVNSYSDSELIHVDDSSLPADIIAWVFDDYFYDSHTSTYKHVHDGIEYL